MITLQKRIWSLLNNGIELMLGIGIVAAITRMYAPAEAGAWFLFIAIFGIAGSLRDALIQSAMIKSIAGNTDHAHVNASLKTNLVVTLGFELIICTIILISSVFFENNIGNLLLYYPVYALPNAWFRWQVFYLRSNLHIKEIFIVNLANLLTITGGLVLLHAYALPLPYALGVLGAGSFAGGVYVLRKLPYRQIFLSRPLPGSLTIIRRYGLYAMLREAASATSSRISLFYSSALLTLSQTALLGVSQRFAQITLLPNNAFQSLLFPSLMKLANEGNIPEAKKVFETSLAQLLAFTIPFACIGAVLSPVILEILSGETYRSAWGILVVYIALSTLITPFGTAFGSMVTALGKPNIAFKVVLVNSILNTALGYQLMRSMGLSGAPVAMALTEIAGFFWIGSILHRLMGISFMNTFRAIPAVYVKAFTMMLSLLNNSKINTALSKK